MPLWISVGLGIFVAKLLEDTLVFGFRYASYRRAKAHQIKAQNLQQMLQNVEPIKKKANEPKGAKNG